MTISTQTATECILIIGANSAIGTALYQRYMELPQTQVIAISRTPQTPPVDHPRTQWIITDHSPANIQDILQPLHHLSMPITRIFICTGILHQGPLQPEKKIEQFDPQHFIQLAEVNVVIPTLWIQQLITLCKSAHPCVITVFSARVGSISDNRLGGWYSYRMTKAALNMMVKTAAVEYARRAKNVQLLAFHPGTTDTPLSKPFQANVPADKLFTPNFVAEQLVTIVNQFSNQLTPPFNQTNPAQFIDWQGSSVDW